MQHMVEVRKVLLRVHPGLYRDNPTSIKDDEERICGVYMDEEDQTLGYMRFEEFDV